MQAWIINRIRNRQRSLSDVAKSITSILETVKGDRLYPNKIYDVTGVGIAELRDILERELDLTLIKEEAAGNHYVTVWYRIARVPKDQFIPRLPCMVPENVIKECNHCNQCCDAYRCKAAAAYSKRTGRKILQKQEFTNMMNAVFYY